ncbi:hypothetical protein ASE85_02535 [Sphingobium sp. Leaf26]|uniref:hypothetical protein n=1 Tax=Sphingobium sp. Leaf26 TaxID=1735693 RepID=UPI0007019F59|nr:hypothetical protein [Sphingobium sp. Leaf26]KQN09831.1 hypothetical protein ASE85_02535 [Sphingobium sp. Leaf26]
MRLRRIRFKDGRAPIEVLHTPQDFDFGDKAESLRGALMGCAKAVVGFDRSDAALDGFIVLGFFDNGTRSLGFRMPARIPRELLPAYVAEILRTDVITEKEATTVFDQRFEWVE